MYVTQIKYTQALQAAGVSLWLDDLSRDRIASGDLQELIDTKNITGVTTNPSIFSKALTNSEAYKQQLAELTAHGTVAQKDIEATTTEDLQDLNDTKNRSSTPTKPSTFAKAITNGEAYNQQMAELAANGTAVQKALEATTADDVRAACDVLARVYEATNGYDGRVSIEV